MKWLKRTSAYYLKTDIPSLCIWFFKEIIWFLQKNINRYMTTLADQLNDHFIQRTRAFQEQNYAWLVQYEHLISHAVTLTFDIKHLTNCLRNARRSITLHDPYVLNLIHGSMGYFKIKLNKSLYGNQRGRILFIPILEGLSSSENPHYHCLLGVDQDRKDVVEEKVKQLWPKAPFGGHQIVVKPYRDHGWIGYTTKQTLFVNRESIDWMNVLLPSCSPSTAEWRLPSMRREESMAL